jgi:hypothetical protein
MTQFALMVFRWSYRMALFWGAFLLLAWVATAWAGFIARRGTVPRLQQLGVTAHEVLPSLSLACLIALSISLGSAIVACVCSKRARSTTNFPRSIELPKITTSAGRARVQHIDWLEKSADPPANRLHDPSPQTSPSPEK